MNKTSFSTLTQLLNHRAMHPSGIHEFIVDGKTYTWSWLWESCQRYASILIQENVKKGDRVVLVVPNSAAFFVAFYGTIMCGAIPVPVFSNSGTERCSQIMKLCGSTHMIIPDAVQVQRKTDFASWAKERDMAIHWVNETPASGIKQALPQIQSHDIAYIQYTSGSTDFPKGIPLTHHNLLVNVSQMTEAMDITSEDVFVSWLPVYHDMGLILNTMVPMYTGARLVLLGEGLHRIHTWLKTIEQYRGTFIAAPDIAYRLCVKGIRDHSAYDLSSLRVALNASEPIHSQTYQMFEEAYNLNQVMTSGYGLAEATVAVTMHPPSKAPRIDANNYVSSGRPLKEVQIKIDNGPDEKGDEKPGEIMVKSPSLMNGYFNLKDMSGVFDRDGFLYTGDMGYLDSEGYLYVLARKKNIIKQAGHTLYPDDIEQVVNALEDVRQTAAIGVDRLRHGGESLLIFAEIQKFQCPTVDLCRDMVISIVNRVYSHFGVRPGKVFLLKPKSLPRTPNGKLQHAKLKELYVKHRIRLDKWILYP